jgi:NADH:ubiquinone oxidoreductase subunit 2 (subunit N)
MAGIPPFLGFFSKYFLILPIINSSFGLMWGFFVLIFHVIGIFNYFVMQF